MHLDFDSKHNLGGFYMYSTKMNRTFSLVLLLGFSYLSNVTVTANDNLRTSNAFVEQTQVENDLTEYFVSMFNLGVENLNMTQKGLTVRFTVSHPSFEKETSFELHKNVIDSLKLVNQQEKKAFEDEKRIYQEKENQFKKNVRKRYKKSR